MTTVEILLDLLAGKIPIEAMIDGVELPFEMFREDLNTEDTESSRGGSPTRPENTEEMALVK